MCKYTYSMTVSSTEWSRRGLYTLYTFMKEKNTILIRLTVTLTVYSKSHDLLFSLAREAGLFFDKKGLLQFMEERDWVANYCMFIFGKRVEPIKRNPLSHIITLQLCFLFLL